VNKQADIISNISNAATEEDFNKWAIAKAQKEQDEARAAFEANPCDFTLFVLNKKLGALSDAMGLPPHPIEAAGLV